MNEQEEKIAQMEAMIAELNAKLKVTVEKNEDLARENAQVKELNENDSLTKYKRMLIKTKLYSRAKGPNECFLMVCEFLFVGSKELRSVLNLLHYAGEQFYEKKIQNALNFGKDF
jgi:hypothetical protein